MRAEGEARVRMAVAGLERGSRVLDIGGGTGAHSEVMQAEGHRPVVLDPSAAQRAKASRRGLMVVGGTSQALPFASGSFDLSYFHLSLHYGDWGEALSEAVRVVGPGGRVWIWTFSRHYLATSFAGRWFPSVHQHDLRRFAEVGDIVAHLHSLGVAEVETQISLETVRRTVGSWEEAFRARFVSTLQLIGDVELQRGLDRFRTEFPKADQIIDVGLEFESIAGSVSG